MTASAATPAPLRAWLPGYLANAVMWGSSFAFIHVGLTALTPVQVAFWRLTLGALALGALAAVTRARLPRSASTWRHLVVYAALQNAVPFTLFAVGLQHVPTVLAAIINAATPLSTLAFLIAVFPEEHPTRRRMVGLLVGFVGILVVLGVWRSFPAAQWQGALACLAAIACYGLAFPYARRHLVGAPEGPIAISTGQIAAAAVLMLPVAAATGLRPHGTVTVGVVGAMVALGALSTGVAFVLNLRVIGLVGSATASTVTYLTPVVAAVIGVLAFGERVTWNEPVGVLVVIGGIVLAQGVPRRRRAVLPDAPQPA
ncbi:DMT family transporter [Isoptericola sp. b441]|uniref:DMT family transporter n=1 Tax=Actinotalea lenta TaxID=3064654 RepID=A0ABT9DC72_9CELL|nr:MULTISPECIES: DMT family transporter [unclassified Isoptericola]MDO8108190.1 DMT family transporter [Isoptericola sp. b441]MDO8120139.1 DMT family transporter [Isoptericola sp. b490]